MTTSLIGLYVVCVFAVCAGAWAQSMALVFFALGISAVAFLFKSIASMLFAANNPGIALLEGGNLVRYHAVEMAAKGLAVPAGQQNTEPPQLIESGDDAEVVQPEYKVGEDSAKPVNY